MGGLCTTGIETVPTETDVMEGTQIPEWVSKGGQMLFAESINLAESPMATFQSPRLPVYGKIDPATGEPIQLEYETITDPETGETRQQLITPTDQLSKLSAVEQEAVEKLRTQSGDYQKYLTGDTTTPGFAGMMSDYTESIGQLNPTAFGQADVDKYMPAYMAAVDPSLQDISDVYTQRRQSLQSQLGGGAYGGSRMGIESAELTRGEARERARTMGEAGRGALEFASAQAEKDKTREERVFDLTQTARLTGARAFQDVAPLVQTLTERESLGLLGVGEAERMLDTQALELAYRDFVEQREYPFSSLNFAIGALKGMPYETREFAMQRGGEVIQTPSVYGQTIGGLGSLYSAYRMLG
tara:strand:- start:2957 stop:4027 length:1071 start_codon:yes stop_codon:yes gene_type:complete